MTADVELLPLPEALFETGSRRDLFNVAQMEGYARAVAEHNVSRERDRAERLAEALRDIESRPWNGVRPIQIAARDALRDYDKEGTNDR